MTGERAATLASYCFAISIAFAAVAVLIRLGLFIEMVLR